MHVPAIVVYKMNPITEFLARLVLKIKWASLVNLLSNKTIYPELLGKDCTAENIIKEIEKLSKPAARKKMISELKAADKFWNKSKPAAELIVEDIIN
jgi:lipid-A-disaccharide synthase